MSDEPTVPPPEALTPAEIERLSRWESRVAWLQVAGMGGLVVAVLALSRYSDMAWLRPLLLGIVLVPLTIAGVLQMQGRCPRCGTRMRSSVLKILPDKCGACGVRFRQ